jgi:inosine-uridine nucleoside N-ribohydrolase
MGIVIDTDPGVDDALALVYARKAGLPVTALSTVYGNNLVESSTRNAGYIARTLNANWRIYQGALKPLEGEGRLSRAHGLSGLGDLMPADNQVTPAESKSAATLFEELAQKKEKFTLFCLGPLTNIARALMENPSLPDKITKMVIMGGAFSEAGANISPYAEFNAYNDPLAFQVTLKKAYEEGIDTTIVPGEVCNEVILTEADLSRLERQDLLPDIRAIVGPYLGYYLRSSSEGNHQGAILYDVLVPLYHKYPELFTTSRVRVEVVQQLPRKGQTVATQDQKSSIQICRSVDSAAACALVLKTLSSKG